MTQSLTISTGFRPQIQSPTPGKANVDQVEGASKPEKAQNATPSNRTLNGLDRIRVKVDSSGDIHLTHKSALGRPKVKALSGAAVIAGAIMMATPLAPVGVGLMILGGVVFVASQAASASDAKKEADLNALAGISGPGPAAAIAKDVLKGLALGSLGGACALCSLAANVVLRARSSMLVDRIPILPQWASGEGGVPTADFYLDRVTGSLTPANPDLDDEGVPPPPPPPAPPYGSNVTIEELHIRRQDQVEGSNANGGNATNDPPPPPHDHPHKYV